MGTNIFDNQVDILSSLLGKSVDGYLIDQMEMVWLTAGRFIDAIYRKNIRLKRAPDNDFPASDHSRITLDLTAYDFTIRFSQNAGCQVCIGITL